MTQISFFSWKDIERYCLINKNQWGFAFESIEVYPSQIEIYKKHGYEQPISFVLQNLFITKYDKQHNCVNLDIGGFSIPIYEYDAQEEREKPVLPLFREALYRDNVYPAHDLPALKSPIIAFHSYKGGVGRTLSLLAFAKAWSTEFAGSGKGRLLLVDADIEAPGLTWIQEKSYDETLSYLDLLALIQDNKDIDRIVDLACSKLKLATISIETPSRMVEHYFIPTYRYEEQLLDLYATPASIVSAQKKEYILASVLSKICDRLGLGATLVDLRAGLSELSATLLFDPRVKKYLVSSTSTQSMKGTQILLKYILKGITIREDTNIPEIFLNMIPDTIPESEKGSIIQELYQCYDSDQKNAENESFTDNVITQLPFASELIHLTSMRQIMQNLNGRDMYIRLQKLVHLNYNGQIQSEKSPVKASERKSALSAIHQLASSQLTAETNNKFDVLMTSPLKYIGKKYGESIPTTVIMGAKGSGKTFLYRKMVEATSWKQFCAALYGSSEYVNEGFFLPAISTRNNTELIGLFHKCIQKINQSIPGAHIDKDVFLNNIRKVERQSQAKEESDYFAFWEHLLVSSISPEFTSFQEADSALESSGKSIVFLIDGLEEILVNLSKSQEERKAVQVLCQDIVSQLVAQYHHLGIIVFIRRDMAQAAISVNFPQFAQAYAPAELKWSSAEALRLAVWLVNNAVQDFYKGPAAIDVASQDIIEENLIRLWGLKLGKPSSNEAYSSRWILAALSDFNGQLQARDIIRFLKYATAPSNKKPPYNDRIIMPTDIRAAVSTCSSEKMDEVKQEYLVLKPIFEKMERLAPEEKLLPIDPFHVNLTKEEENSMIQEGYLKRDNDKYYLPEIARHALGFKYGKGARPKVLSLTLRQ